MAFQPYLNYTARMKKIGFFAISPLVPLSVLGKENIRAHDLGGAIAGNLQLLIKGLVIAAIPVLLTAAAVTLTLGLVAAAFQTAFFALHSLTQMTQDALNPSVPEKAGLKL